MAAPRFSVEDELARLRILASATQLFRELGHEGTPVARIAEDTPG